MIRSLLFVPGDSPRKFSAALRTAADALILDLEDAVAPAQKARARIDTPAMLRSPEALAAPMKIFVRLNALDTGMTLTDLAAVMPAAPFGVVLPKCRHAQDVHTLALYLDAFEAAAGLPGGRTKILAIATETAVPLFGLASAAAAGVEAIDTVAVDIRDLDKLLQEARDARRDGFSGKAVIHPSHVDPVNTAFTATQEERLWAQRVVGAFAAHPDAGVVQMDGKMLDKPPFARRAAHPGRPAMKPQPTRLGQGVYWQDIQPGQRFHPVHPADPVNP